MLKRLTIVTVVLVGGALVGFSQQPKNDTSHPKAGPPRPDPLVFREMWTAPTNDHVPVTQKSVGNLDLELHLYGSGKDMDTVLENGGPLHVWTGNCFSPC